MREIPLTLGKIAIVDDEDYLLVAGGEAWRAHRGNQRSEKWYARRRPIRSAPWVWMHRLIISAPHGVPVDHADGDGLNNRRSNLRLCTFSLNSANCRMPVGVSGLRGAYPSGGKWRAYISVARAIRYLGTFSDKVDAARAYDAAALAAFGEFAVLNFPKTLPDLCKDPAAIRLDASETGSVLLHRDQFEGRA